MVTELMLILIVVGAGIIFIVWSNSRKKQKNNQDLREVEESTNKFKADLEKTANEIIGRMESQAAKLETLLDDSERNRTQLEGRVIELKKLLKRTEGQSTEIRDLLERLDDAVEDVDAMQKQMDSVERKINAAINVKIPQPPLINPLPITPPLINPIIPQNPASPTVNSIPNPITPPPIIPRTPPPPEPQEEFSKILEKSIAQEEIKSSETIPRPPDRNSIVLSREINQPMTVVEAEPIKIESQRRKSSRKSVEKLPVSIAERQARVLAERQGRNAEKIQQQIPERSTKIREAAVAAIKNAVEQENTVDIEVETEKNSPQIQKISQTVQKSEKIEQTPDSSMIREMLLSGMSVEDIAREIGVGRGAVELVQQMIRRQLERR